MSTVSCGNSTIKKSITHLRFRQLAKLRGVAQKVGQKKDPSTVMGMNKNKNLLDVEMKRLEAVVAVNWPHRVGNNAREKGLPVTVVP